MAETIYIDLTELISFPVRTGIQRVERELIRNWEGPAKLVPIRFESSSGFLEVNPEILQRLNDPQPTGNIDVLKAETANLVPCLLNNPVLDMRDPNISILNLELFFDPERCAYYRGLPPSIAKKTFFLVYDFFPHLRPEFFDNGATKYCMHYVKTIREISNIGFISQQTKQEFSKRITRGQRDGGPVFPLGGDGVSLEKQVFSKERHAFAIVGTIEPRKQVFKVLKAFEMLWAKNIDAELFIIGKLTPQARQENELLSRLAGDRRLHYCAYASDDEMRSIMRRTRATIFVSAVEGFGIPPYESLTAGIPVICCTHEVPSLQLISDDGQFRLPDTDPSTIANAVESVLDDEFCSRLWEKAARIEIPTWKEFARKLAAWTSGAA